MATKTKADTSFSKKLEALLIRPIICDFNTPERPVYRKPLDVQATEQLFLQYGNYLELVDA